ncbi:MAG: tyrosine-type recombinase/integrase [Planctomycetota bacterium]|nr:tyrosine-type recombinase/integrase [Planctomycetota bacterium]
MDKNGRGRTIPMSMTLVGEIMELRSSQKITRADGTDPVFTTSNGSPVAKGILSRMMETAKSRCGDIREEKRAKITFHCLRHTAASLMVQAGVSIFEVAKILGHSTTAVTMRYAHFAPQASMAAIDRLDSVIRGATGAEERKGRTHQVE